MYRDQQESFSNILDFAIYLSVIKLILKQNGNKGTLYGVGVFKIDVK